MSESPLRLPARFLKTLDRLRSSNTSRVLGRRNKCRNIRNIVTRVGDGFSCETHCLSGVAVGERRDRDRRLCIDMIGRVGMRRTRQGVVQAYRWLWLDP